MGKQHAEKLVGRVAGLTKSDPLRFSKVVELIRAGRGSLGISRYINPTQFACGISEINHAEAT
jgi:hypothetical protein